MMGAQQLPLMSWLLHRSDSRLDIQNTPKRQPRFRAVLFFVLQVTGARYRRLLALALMGRLEARSANKSKADCQTILVDDPSFFVRCGIFATLFSGPKLIVIRHGRR